MSFTLESALYVISDGLRRPRRALGSLAEVLNISRDWKLAFTSSGRKVEQATLTDWTADPATLHYSGEAVYAHDFTLDSVPHQSTYLQIDGGLALDERSVSALAPSLGADGLPDPKKTLPGPGMGAAFVPPVREAATVVINGHQAGALWHPPYRLELTNFLRAGSNHIEIHVYDTALNAWSEQPPHDYGPLIERYGDRFQMQDLDQVEPISSGLLGAIRLMTDEQQE